MTAQTNRLSRRSLVAGIGVTAGAYALGVATPGVIERLRPDPVAQAVDGVTPAGGYPTNVVFADAIVRLVRAGAIDPDKFAALYAARGGLPDWVGQHFVAPSTEPIVMSAATAPYLLNLLWPLGLSAKTEFNANSPLNGERLPVFASTGGWRLGRAETGESYFNQVEAVALSAEQELRVLNVAADTFRPCCNNSAFFQDCNHGSAMLGLLELGASQGLSEPELFRIAKAANGYWYPTQYVEMAMLFNALDGARWRDVDPAKTVSAEFASASGWRANVHQPLLQTDLLRPAPGRSSAGCAV